MKTNYLTFYPAEFPPYFRDFEKYKENLIPELNYWNPDENPYGYNKILLSMGLIKPDRDEIAYFKERTKNTIVMGDSGGFQYGTKSGNHLNPEWVIKTQQEFCNLGYILDAAPHKAYPKEDYDRNYFERCARITAENALIAQKHHYNEDFLLYGIIQGKNEEEWDYWLKKITEDTDYDGFAIRAFDHETGIRAFNFLKEHDLNKNIHFFGTRNVRLLAVITRMTEKYGFKNVSSDASFRLNTFYLQSGHLKGRRRFGKTEKIKDFQFPLCNCYLCQKYTEFMDNNNLNKADIERNENKYLFSHYILEFLNTIAKINSCADSSNDIIDLFEADSSTKKIDIDMIKYLKLVEENDIGEIYSEKENIDLMSNF